MRKRDFRLDVLAGQLSSWLPQSRDRRPALKVYLGIARRPSPSASPASRRMAARSRSVPAATSGLCRPPVAKRACSWRMRRPIGVRCSLRTGAPWRSSPRGPAAATSTRSRSRPAASRRLTWDDGLEQLDGWSADSRWIYFSSTGRDIAGMNDVFRVAAPGGTPFAVTDERYVNEFGGAPAPDGRRLAFVARGIASNQWWRRGSSHIDQSELWTVDLESAEPAYTQITPARIAADVADLEWRRRVAVLRVRSRRRREHLDASRRGRGRRSPRSRRSLPDASCGRRPRPTRARSSSNATSPSGRSTRRRARRVPCRFPGAAPPRRPRRSACVRPPSSAISRSRLTAGRWPSSRTGTCLPHRRAMAATRRA